MSHRYFVALDGAFVDDGTEDGHAAADFALDVQHHHPGALVTVVVVIEPDPVDPLSASMLAQWRDPYQRGGG